MNLIWEKYENPVYGNESGTMIICDLTVISPPLGVIPFAASSTDVHDHGKDIYNAILANIDTVPIGQYVPTSPK
jgi:hypothetical protein